MYMTKYYDNLIKSVLNKSQSNNWDEAVKEWTIVDCEEDESCSSQCVCGKENLKYLYTIKNHITNKSIYPIGSSCINKFERNELKDEIVVREKLFKLYHQIENTHYIEFNSNLFSRKLLLWLYENKAFKPSKFNDFYGRNDYIFLLDMFNKRSSNITANQKKKVNAIVIFSIKPYLERNIRIRNQVNYK